MNPLATVLLSIVTALISSSLASVAYSYYTKRRDERRNLYSKGLMLLSSREEIYYMILRRPRNDTKHDRELVDLMHQNQTEISNHQAVLEVDSYWMGGSYRKAVKSFRILTEQLFRDAWTNPLKHSTDSVPKDRRIDTSVISRKHAVDCRRRLNPVRSAWNTLIRWRKR